MKFFAILFVLCGIAGFAIAASSSSGSGSVSGTGSIGTGTGTLITTTTNQPPPCGNGLCDLLKPCRGSKECGQKLYFFN